MVIALDKHKRPLGFMTERRARILMEKKRAVLYRTYPAVVIVKDRDAREMENLPTYRIKIDPGACHTGIAVVCNETNEVVLCIQIHHRGSFVKKAVDTRRMTRRNRRNRETRYRRSKFSDGGRFESPRPKGWIPPSVKSTADNIVSWVRRLKKYINITECSFEAVRFDSQLMDNPEISGKEYQYGTLEGTEIKEYLLDKYAHTCQYCGGKTGDEILEWEHMVPKSRGGSDSVKNACLACHTCNQDKDDRTLPEYLTLLKSRKSKPGSRAEKLNSTRIRCVEKAVRGIPVKVSSRYCAWVNSSRRYVEKNLFNMFGNVECASGGKTKYNRVRLGLPKDHHYDALCVGSIPEEGYRDRTGGYVLHADAMGRGTRLRGQINRCGVITVKYSKSPKLTDGFMTGDIVRANNESGKYVGVYTGRVMTRKSGWFDVRCADGKLITTKSKNCRLLQHNCGFNFHYEKGAIPPGN